MLFLLIVDRIGIAEFGDESSNLGFLFFTYRSSTIGNDALVLGFVAWPDQDEGYACMVFFCLCLVTTLLYHRI